ncbi:uncharacterized protein LOC131429010 [Malaya genurostris]|uniref:uncharacterized protein LOC131429010 n=1 Tax=Malaya genurostris TaxID=325434 RepID=UPI0026F38298|nr:uncharacterized protein LOC131429010 [Malaya genurostris]
MSVCLIFTLKHTFANDSTIICFCSLLFYANGGKGTGHEHTGYIQRHIRNLANKVPTELKKYRRRMISLVDDPEMIGVAKKCAKKEATTANFILIRDSMLQCVKLHTTLVARKGSAKEIMTTFPHFRSYNGKLISVHFHSVKSIRNYGLRGCLRIMLKLNNRGIKRSSEGGSIEEDPASPLIRWIPDTDEAFNEQITKYAASYTVNGCYPPAHILCHAEKFKSGTSYIYIDGELIRCRDNMITCIDVLVKAFVVFHVKPPAQLYKLIDFLYITGYKIMTVMTNNDFAVQF